MKTNTSDRTGILIVRLWMEAPPDGFRARIVQTLDSMNSEHAMAAAATPEDVYAAVQTWVEEFVDSS
jgi:hypothetical protein